MYLARAPRQRASSEEELDESEKFIHSNRQFASASDTLKERSLYRQFPNYSILSILSQLSAFWEWASIYLFLIEASLIEQSVVSLTSLISSPRRRSWQTTERANFVVRRLRKCVVDQEFFVNSRHKFTSE